MVDINGLRCYIHTELDCCETGDNPISIMKSVSKLLSLMPENDLCDIYRLRNPDIR